MNNNPVGVFDSGLGGLTVLKSLEKYFPNESFIYFGDTGRVPYGNKSQKTIINYSIEISRFLLKKNVKLIVVACNTSSALALKTLKSIIPVPVFGVIEPSVFFTEKSYPSSEKIAVIGTSSTINSQAYLKQFKVLKSKKIIIEKACPLFVPLIEEGITDGEVAENVVKYYLKNFKKKDIKTFILGCTHYPIIKPALYNYLGNNVNLITSCSRLSVELSEYMLKNNCQSSKKKTETIFYVTDLPNKFSKIGSRFLGKNLKNINYIKTINEY